MGADGDRNSGTSEAGSAMHASAVPVELSRVETPVGCGTNTQERTRAQARLFLSCLLFGAGVTSDEIQLHSAIIVKAPSSSWPGQTNRDNRSSC